MIDNAGIEERLRAHVYRLSDEIGERNVAKSAALHAAQEYIQKTWQSQGYDVATQVYTESGVPCANLIATRRGILNPEEIILIGAHYDSVAGSPGADDNASGIAALLELSYQFRTLEPRRTFRFAAFVNEEPPFFLSARQGSRIYARAALAREDNIRLMVSLEMLGYYSSEPGSQRYPPLFRYFYPDRGDFIAFVSNLRSRGIMHQLAQAFRDVCDVPLQHVATFSFIPGVAWSDHLSFWVNGYRALMVTDTAFYRNRLYHTAQDTAEKLDYLRFADVTAGLCQAFSRLGETELD